MQFQLQSPSKEVEVASTLLALSVSGPWYGVYAYANAYANAYAHGWPGHVVWPVFPGMEFGGMGASSPDPVLLGGDSGLGMAGGVGTGAGAAGSVSSTREEEVMVDVDGDGDGCESVSGGEDEHSDVWRVCAKTATQQAVQVIADARAAYQARTGQDLQGRQLLKWLSLEKHYKSFGGVSAKFVLRKVAMMMVQNIKDREMAKGAGVGAMTQTRRILVHLLHLREEEFKDPKDTKETWSYQQNWTKVLALRIVQAVVQHVPECAVLRL
jgi:hypothetical protein